MNAVALTVLVLIVARWVAQLGLARLNRRHVEAHAGAIPATFRELIDENAYAKSVEYTLARDRLHQIEATLGTGFLILILFTGVLPWSHRFSVGTFGDSVWATAGYLFAVAIALSVVGWPLDWYAQFRLEERFGFNTTTRKLWWIDRLKGFVLAAVMGYPLLVLILKLVDWTGETWWLWAWAVIVGFQLLMLVLAPVLILPLFNKFAPLPEGGLHDRLMALARRAGFQARQIQVMDGSRRSRHSNAFFTGFGRFRKIVLFDTLIEQLRESELAAVLAHEIGHYKKGHVPKMLVASTFGLLAGLLALAWLAKQGWFYRGLGFEAGDLSIGLLLFGLLSGTITFWLTPLWNSWSRRFEYEADAFAVGLMKEAGSLIGALRKLNEKNLSNLTPHPAYSAFYYSHPALMERENAITRLPSMDDNEIGASARNPGTIQG